MAKAYKKLYGTPTYSASDAVAPVPMDYAAPQSPADWYSQYGDTSALPDATQTQTAEPIGSGNQGQVGIPPSGAVTPDGYQNYYPQDIPQAPVPVAPERYMGNLPEMGRIAPYDPSKSEQENKNDRRNFLIGLSVVGAINPHAVASYIQSGAQGISENEDKRTAQARFDQQQKIAEVGRQYEADKDRYALGQKTVDSTNDTNAKFNTNREDIYGHEVALHNNYQTQDRIEHSAKVRVLADQYKVKLKGILDQFKNNLGPDAVDALTDSANDTAMALKSQGVDVADITDSINADSTISDENKAKAVAALNRANVNNTAAQKRIETAVAGGLVNKKLTLEQQDRQDIADRALRKSIAETNATNDLIMARMRRDESKYGVDSANTRAANELAYQKAQAAKGFGPGTAQGQQASKFATQLLNAKDTFQKYTQSIIAFKHYDASTGKGTVQADGTTWKSPADKAQYDLLVKNRDDAVKNIDFYQQQYDAIMNGKSATMKAPVPGRPLMPYPVSAPKALPKVNIAPPTPPSTHKVVTPARGQAAVKRAQQAPRNPAASIAKSGVVSPPAPKPLVIPLPKKVQGTGRYSGLSKEELLARYAEALKHAR